MTDEQAWTVGVSTVRERDDAGHATNVLTALEARAPPVDWGDIDALGIQVR